MLWVGILLGDPRSSNWGIFLGKSFGLGGGGGPGFRDRFPFYRSPKFYVTLKKSHKRDPIFGELPRLFRVLGSSESIFIVLESGLQAANDKDSLQSLRPPSRLISDDVERPLRQRTCIGYRV